MATSFFGGNFFGGEFFNVSAVAEEVVVKTGTGGIDPPRKRRTIYKPTGLLERKKEGKEGVEQRIEEARAIHEEIKEEIALSFREEKPVQMMDPGEVDREIARLLHKKLRTEEEELMMLLMMLND